MSALDDARTSRSKTVPSGAPGWRRTTRSATGAWMVTWRAGSGRAGLDYVAAVEEALCFGWVDSTGGKVDDERGKLYFAPRKPRSAWAATNKARVERLIADGPDAAGGDSPPSNERRRTDHGRPWTPSSGWRSPTTSRLRSMPARRRRSTSRRSRRRHARCNSRGSRWPDGPRLARPVSRRSRTPPPEERARR